MARPLIVLGDKTDHDGAVIEGSPVTDAAGKAIARVRNKVSCPRSGHGHHGITVIAIPKPDR